jgi:hypothetical protein
MFQFFLPGVIQYGKDEVTYASFRYLHGSSGSVLLSSVPGCFDPKAWSFQRGASYKCSWRKPLYHLTNTVCLLVTPCLLCSSYFPEKSSVPFRKLTDPGRVSRQVVCFSWPVLCWVVFQDVPGLSPQSQWCGIFPVTPCTSAFGS